MLQAFGDVLLHILLLGNGKWIFSNGALAHPSSIRWHSPMVDEVVDGLPGRAENVSELMVTLRDLYREFLMGTFDGRGAEFNCTV